MNEYIFGLGRTVDLCLAELSSVISNFEKVKISYHQEQIALVESPNLLDLSLIISRLGGTIKAGEVLFYCNEDEIVQKIADYLEKSSGEKIYFAISSYVGNISSHDLSIKVKKSFKGAGRVRFFPSKDNELSASQLVLSGILKNGIELLVFSKDGKIGVAKTQAVYDFKSFAFRDADRPFSNPKKGMLPPRVARMMINLSGKGSSGGLRLLDPFCGVGTIINEALVLGFIPFGSDISNKATLSARENLKWLIKNHPNLALVDYNFDKSIVCLDATHISSAFPSEFFDCIVTEPFMGPLFTEFPKTEQAERILDGLDRMYKGFLKESWRVLKRDGTIVMVFPTLRVKNGDNKPIVKHLKIIDSVNNLGYNVVQGPLTYSRPDAFLLRNIYVLSKKV